MDNINYESGDDNEKKLSSSNGVTSEVIGKKRLHSEKTAEDEGDAAMIYQANTLNTMEVFDGSSESESSSDEDFEDDDSDEESDVQEDDEATGPTCNDLAYIAELIGPVITEAPAVATMSNSTLMENGNEENEEDESSDDESEEEGEDVVMEADDESDDSSSDDSDSDTDDDLDTKNRKKKMMSEMMTEEEAENLPSGPPRTKHEAEEEPVIVPPIKRVTFPTTEQTTLEGSSSSSSGAMVHDRTNLTLIGEVLYHILHEHTIVVQAFHTTNPLNEKSLLCNQDGLVLGVIHEVFGPITTPFYIVRYKGNNNKNATQNSQPSDSNNKNKNKSSNKKNKNKQPTTEPMERANDEVIEMSETVELSENTVTSEAVQVDSEVIAPAVEDENQVEDASKEPEPEEEQIDYERVFSVNSSVYAVPTHAIFITPGQISMWKTKGSDASNAFDEEPSEGEIEYSDDEEELLAKQARNRLKKQQKQQQQPANSQTFNAELAMQGQSQSFGGRQQHTQRRPHSQPVAFTNPSITSSTTSGSQGYRGGMNNQYQRQHAATSLIATLAPAPALKIPQSKPLAASHISSNSMMPQQHYHQQHQYSYNTQVPSMPLPQPSYPINMPNMSTAASPMMMPAMPWMNPTIPQVGGMPMSLPTYQYQPLGGGTLQQQQQQQLAHQQAQAQAQAYYMALMMQQQQQQNKK